MREKKLLIIDGNGLLYRAFYAFPPLTTSTGEPIGAVYGFCRILLAALRTLQPTHAAVAFDLAAPTFRHIKYDSYKATRQKMPDELAAQIERMHQVVEHLEVPIYVSEGFEADDVIGTIARQASAQGSKVVILSGDKDLLQLVDDMITVACPGSGSNPIILFDAAAVKAKYGFSPMQMIEYKSLAGDNSDNIPGVTGIGEVTAKTLLASFYDLKGIYAAIEAGTDNLKPALRQKLIDQKEQAELSHYLATIRLDVPVEYNAESSRLELLHPDRLVHLFQELGFKSLIKELPKSHFLLSEAADVFLNGAVLTANVPLAQEGESDSQKTDQELLPILREMEETGVKVDLPYLKELETTFNAEIAAERDQLFTYAGQPFNPDSPQQVAQILYEVLHIPTRTVRKGKTGFTTDGQTLTELAKEFPIAQTLLTYRELQKLQTTYIRPLQELADSSGRVHTSYATDTSTGRISSKNPNLQNIPVRSERGRQIRRAFIAPPGKKLVAADYSQIELRIAAHLSQDPVMIEAFQAGRDFHAETAARMKVDRRVAKVINFSILYGKGAYGFSQDLGISLAEAKQYIEQYYKTFATLREYLDSLLGKVRRDGYAETLLGRRRYFPEINSSNFQRRSAAEREASNLPIQGTAADILKLAMVKVAPAIKKLHHTHLILTVHDELVVEVPQDKVEKVTQILTQTMTSAYKLSVPLEVNVKSGANWADLKEF
jgi:DNA polymerase I-like protein with 3'-5' exonuclease and polymerase domains/5'-3' exonuclease